MSSKDEGVFWPILYLPLVKFQSLRGEEVQRTNTILSTSMTQSRASPLPVGPDLPRERESDSWYLLPRYRNLRWPTHEWGHHRNPPQQTWIPDGYLLFHTTTLNYWRDSEEREGRRDSEYCVYKLWPLIWGCKGRAVEDGSWRRSCRTWPISGSSSLRCWGEAGKLIWVRWDDGDFPFHLLYRMNFRISGCNWVEVSKVHVARQVCNSEEHLG